MFRAVPMLRLSAVVLERDERTVLRGLGDLGVMHLMRMPAGPDTAPLEPPDRGEERARCTRLIERVEALRLALAIPSVAAPADEEPLPLDHVENALAGLEQQVAERAARGEELRERLGQVTAVVDQVSSFQGLAVPFDQLSRFSFLHFAVGSLPGAQLGDVQQQVGENVVLLPLQGSKERRPVVAVTSRKGRFALDTALKKAGFQAEAWPGTEGLTAEKVAAEGVRERERLEQALQALEQETARLAASTGPMLGRIQRVLVTEDRMLEADGHFTRTEVTVLVTGWVPAAEGSEVESRLKDLTHGRCVVETAAAEDLPETEVPVLLRHSRFLRPFEMLVAGYGLPRYRELEPTLFVAVSYLLMFGMMFGDVGHGAVLVLGGVLALRAGRTRKVRDVGYIVLWAGLSSIVFGAVYGSCFGLEELRHYALWRDPLEGDPTSLMALGVGLGVVIISLGLLLNVLNHFRRGDVLGGFLDRFGVIGAVFYWGVLALILKYAALQQRGLVGMVVVLVVVLPLVGMVLREPVAYALRRRAGARRDEGHYLQRVMEGTVEAFETVLGYMANTISFVRLAAYAMSHAAILMATFVMAAEVGQVKVGGGVLSLVVIIVGNLVAILLEGVIASVQALRLEYYEFFSKFFSGRGEAFRPFRLATGASEDPP